MELRALAAELGIAYTQQIDTTHVEYVASELEKEQKSKQFQQDSVDIDFIAAPKLITQKWNIPLNDVYHAPVGLANNRVNLPRSLGNEEYVMMV